VKRFAVPLVIFGSLAVLVALFLLLRSITAAPAEPVSTATKPRPVEVAGPAPAPAAPTIWDQDTPTPKPVTNPKVNRTSGDLAPALPSAPTVASEGSSDAPPGTRANTKNLHYGTKQLNERIALNAPHVQACLNGTKATGEVTLTFVAAQKPDKVVIEQADADREKSTVKDEALLECLAKTSTKIVLDGLPREAPAIFVTRVMTLEDGTLTGDRSADFSYIR